MRIQTRYPRHPLFAALARHDFAGFAQSQLEERRAGAFPPFVFEAALRAEAKTLAASLEFHAPLHFEEEFEVLIKIAEKTRRSIRYTTEITRGDTKIASGTHTAVCVRKSPPPMKAVPIPDDIVARLS